MDLKKFWKTHEFWLAVTGVAVVVLNDGLGIGVDKETLWQLVALVLGWSGLRTKQKADLLKADVVKESLAGK